MSKDGVPAFPGLFSFHNLSFDAIYISAIAAKSETLLARHKAM